MLTTLYFNKVGGFHMCLEYLVKYPKEWESVKEITAWKVCGKCKGRLHPPYETRPRTYRKAWQRRVSSSKTIRVSTTTLSYYPAGYHLFITRKAARMNRGGNVVKKCLVKVSDIVAYGRQWDCYVIVAKNFKLL